MAPTRRQLKVTLSWVLSDSDTDCQQYLEAYQLFLAEQATLIDREATVEFSNVYQRPTKGLYEEPLLNIDCVVEWPGYDWFGLSSKYDQVGRAWCEEGRKRCNLLKCWGRARRGMIQWMFLSPAEAFPQGTHPVDRDVGLLSVSFGTLVHMDTFVEHHIFSGCLKNGHRNYRTQATFQHDQRMAHIDLHLNHLGECDEPLSEYRFLLPYANILKVLMNEKARFVELYLHLKIPAMLMGEMVDTTGRSSAANGGGAQGPRWERHLKVGCKCLKNVVRTSSLCGGLILKLVARDATVARRVIGRLTQRCPHTTLFGYAPVRTFVSDRSAHRWADIVQKRCESMQKLLPFPCAYAFKAVLHITFDVLDQMLVMPERVFDALMLHLEEMGNEQPSTCERALSHIVSSIDAGNIVNFAHAFSAGCAVFHGAKPPQLARGTCLVRSVFITPGRLILRPAQVHFENRVLREFNSEYAIRASFRDDNLDKLSFTLNLHSCRDVLLDAVVGRFMREGMSVGSRKFKFLASSTSQLRDHGTWMYAVDEQHNTASTIRSWMGEFEGIRNVAKRMARMGQCFSSTEQAVRVEPCHVEDVPDLVGGSHPISKKPYVFSDGVGMMSMPLAAEVYDMMKLKDCPSAIQIRYAGAKGMLCVNPELPMRKLLCLRPSMRKFPCSSSEYLEVIKVSAPRSVTLNRPLITILEQLGVQEQVFMRLQETMILEFTDALVTESSAVGVLSSWSKLPLPYQDLSKAGFQLTLDPFFRSLLLAVYRNAVAGLRYKTRIALPVDKARNMLGVVDTTNTLQYGQVFVQCTEMGCPPDQPPRRQVVTGTVLVTKCPCLHPGDVRKFEAIDVPRLRHVVDCIVFPGQGPRPHPDEMAGSDLDGDEYVVIWMDCLFFPGENQEPMTFSDRHPETEPNDITIDDMIKFVCNYIKNDSIGILSNAHLAWADQELEGIFSARCLSIAEKISVCLDFAKNGRTAFLRREERPLIYPDFMEKGTHKTTYRSNRALGLLYRTCRSLEAAIGNLGHRHVEGGRCRALVVPGWEEYRDSAQSALTEYNANLRRILNQYGISSEGEVMACMVNTFDTYHTAQSDKLNMEDLVEKMTKFLTETTRTIFFSELLDELDAHHVTDEQERMARRHRKASAWYMVTYGPQAESGFFSFPWCIADVLIEILRNSDPRDREWHSNILYRKIDDVIENNDELAVLDNNSPSGVDVVETTYQIIEKWLREETMVGEQEPSAQRKPNLCPHCLRSVFAEFVGSEKLVSLPGKLVMRKRHTMMLSAESSNAHRLALTESEQPTAKHNGVAEQNGERGDQGSTLPNGGGSGEPDASTGIDKRGPTNNPRKAVDVSTCEDETPLGGIWGDLPPDSPSPEPPVKGSADRKASEGSTSVGAMVVSFLRWCLEQEKLPREECPLDECAGGGCGSQTHRLPMVALRAFSSLAVSLDPCHVALPCDPALHEPYQAITERDPVRIQLANPAMYEKFKGNLDEVRQLLMRWTGVQDVHIQWQDEANNREFITVTSTGRDWQIWFLEELLLQKWLPQAIECGSLDRFLKEEGHTTTSRWTTRIVASSH
ncbi:uncharacterized protein LOC144162939 [Haemaphysalis longicornis]